jgi:2TM domain
MEAPSEEELREEAVASLKRKRAFKQSALTYVLVNILLVVIWAVDGTDNFFWPIFVIAGWGTFLGIQAYAAYGQRQSITEEDISGEMNRLRGGSG